MALNKLNFPAVPFLVGDTRPIDPSWIQWLMAPRVNTISFSTALGPDSGGTGSTTIPSVGQILVGTTGGVFSVQTLLPASAMPALTGDVTSIAGTVAMTIVHVNASAIDGILGVPHGGTGLSSGTSGGILGFTAGNVLASSGALTQHALMLGGGAGATPGVLASLGTTTTVLHGNAAGDPTFGAVDLTADVTGVLPVANGGSGLSAAPTNGQVDIGNGTGFSRATLTQGSGVTITNGAGTITIAATGTGGTVTTISVVSANGLAGSVANPTTTPAITLSTTVTGILKGNGTAISAAVAGTDYLSVLSGDATTSGNAITFATVNANVGSFGSSTSIPTFTVNAKGLITAASGNAVVAPAGTLTGATLAAGVTASSLTSVGTLVNLTVTNPITGSITGSSGSTTGNAATATTLQTARNINGTSFNGSADITVTAAAGTLTGATLASNVLASSLTSVGTLGSLGVTGTATAGAFSGPLTGNASTATSVAGGTANQIPYQTGVGTTSFYSGANYGVQTYTSAGVPSSVAGAAGVLQGSASAIPAFTTTPTLTGTNFSGIPNGALNSSSVTIGTTAISLGSSSTSLAGLTTLSMNNQLTNTLAVGTAPFVVTSTTRVANLNVAVSGTADTLTTARTINGTSFDGSTNITVTAAAGTLTGATLAAGVTASSLTSVGTLTSLTNSGNDTSAAFIPSGSTVPTNGMYLPAANNLGFSTGSTRRVQIDSSGNVGVGGNPPSLTNVIPTLQVIGANATNSGGVSVISSDGTTWFTMYSGSVSGDSPALLYPSNAKLRWGATTNAGIGGFTDVMELSGAGQLALQVAGQGFSVKEGSNAKMGTATLVAGAKVVSTTAVTASSRIFLTVQSLGTVTVPTSVGVTARTAGTSFTITSANVIDTSVVAWIIFEPS